VYLCSRGSDQVQEILRVEDSSPAAMEALQLARGALVSIPIFLNFQNFLRPGWWLFFLGCTWSLAIGGRQGFVIVFSGLFGFSSLGFSLGKGLEDLDLVARIELKMRGAGRAQITLDPLQVAMENGLGCLLGFRDRGSGFWWMFKLGAFIGV